MFRIQQKLANIKIATTLPVVNVPINVQASQYSIVKVLPKPVFRQQQHQYYRSFMSHATTRMVMAPPLQHYRTTVITNIVTGNSNSSLTLRNFLSAGTRMMKIFTKTTSPKNTLASRYFSTTGTAHRAPTPPMPRINYMIRFHDDADFVIPLLNISAKETKQGWFSTSTILTVLGWSLLSVTLIDLYLQGYGTNYYYNLLSNKYHSLFSNSDSTSNTTIRPMTTKLNKDEMIKELMNDIRQKRQFLYDQYVHTKPLYQCKVIKPYKMGGSHGLYNDIQLNDIVDVLVENVGPKQAYHLCRFVHPPPTSTTNDYDNLERVIMKDENGNIIELGWYPTAYLEKIDPMQNDNNQQVQVKVKEETTNSNTKTRPWWKKWLFPFL
jgi:hypothetical protein